MRLPDGTADPAAPYPVGFGCRDDEPLQSLLNALYDYRDDVETKVLHRSRLNLFHGLMRDLIRRGIVRRFGRALDLGCNAGYYSKMISDFGFESVLGVDIEAEFVARAQRVFGAGAPRRREFRVMNAEELDERDAFDFVLCTEVIEHTARPERVVERLARALAPGGIAIVTLPNAVSIPYAWARLVHALRRRPIDPVLRDHLSYPFYRSVRLFERTGLHVLRTTGTNLALFGPVIRRLYRSSAFPLLHRADFALSRIAPLKYCAQFFFMVLRREG